MMRSFSFDSSMVRRGALVALVLLAGNIRPAAAQANLSGQGFGFPTGQLSTRAWGTGGAIAEIDPLSPVNPASVAMHGARIVNFQIEPEFRTVTAGSTTEHTTIARYPNVFVAVPVGSSWVVGVGASTLLDRTSTTQFTTTQFLGTDTIPMHTRYRIDGAMADVRLALGWNPRSWLRVGAGVNAITGHNLVEVTETFDDTLRFSTFTQSLVLGFSGVAASGGVQLLNKYWNLGISGRSSGPLNASSSDSVISRARVPSRYGATLAYTGIANSAIAVRASHDNWSSLNGLGSPGLKAVDAWDTSVGADIAGPRLGNRILFLRGGLRDRTLPYQASGHTVKEQSVTGGLGTTWAAGRVLTDFAAIYADRSASLAASEKAWTLSFGISIRP